MAGWRRLRSFSRDGLLLDVRDEGPADAATVVLLHGFPETSESWRDVTPRLVSAGYRTLAPDQRGYSPRARPRRRRDYRRPELVADVIALVDQAGVETFHVVGHDWGAVVAWALAIEHPDRVRTLTSLSIPHPAAFRRAALSGRQALRSWYMAFFQLPAVPEAMLSARNWVPFRQNMLRSGLEASFADVYTEHMRQPGALTAALNWYRGLRPIADGRGVSVSVPTLLIWGGKDAYIDEKGVRLTERYVTGPYRLEVLRDEGHWLPEAASGRVVELLLPNLSAHR
jgi:pimeloyl-ACP methyl ester carboxylesterase